ncbi:DUF5682 family protein [Streptomyces spiramenti]|uniref:Uncharacterized protein n=1 Tax=Streptomyces spiramenti TaxID=2720606 RepID=A0ABX1APU9_9ACTN|nr:DUF5682 family protein [Streptomyces spiramenti]NJP67656.1 hypothetical protein [Streptomyces spiramenti]
MTDRPLLLGVRHHGPGSARSVRAALEAHRPAVVLVEGPPEADDIVSLAADPAMSPPVALLAHAVNDSGRSAFWPLAAFSPEWVAIRWALDHDVPVRFVDLPAAHSLAPRDEAAPGAADAPAPESEGAPAADADGAEEPAGNDTAADPADPADHRLRRDPLAALAAAAGHDDPERWWEDVVEHRAGGDDPVAPFAAVEEAMTELRAAGPATGDDRDLVREAHMRLRLREAVKEFGAGSVAVVCGAWHVPALRERRTVAADRALLRGLPKVRTEITWVPWTHRRLGRAHGYGAGIESPGWYGHLYSAADRPVARWMTKVAGLLRDEGVPISSAHVIEAVRLAETLAAMRGRPLAGLGETIDAVRAVMCDGADVPLDLVVDRLVVGDVLGEVPDSAPAVPLQRDLTAQQRRLRLKPEAEERALDLDLRKDNDAARSRLLYRLRLLGVPWATPAGGTSTGTFRESWRLAWEPELAVRVAESGIWGTTVESAAAARARADADAADSLAALTTLAELCLLAGLGEALPTVMGALADRAALDTDVAGLAAALPALVRSARYGDVRSTGTEELTRVAHGLAERVCVGLPAACTGLDDDGAAAMRHHVESTHAAIALLDEDGLRDRWRGTLRRLARRDTVPAVLRGRAARFLLDEGVLAEDEADRLIGLELSPAVPPARAAGWIEGFLAGGGLLLVHDERLLGLIDAWLAAVPADSFTDVLPLLRRSFGSFEPGVRRSVGELVRRSPGAETGGSATAPTPGFGDRTDPERADAALPVLRLLLGPEFPGHDAARAVPPATEHPSPADDPIGAPA